jgi:hypothetical protein
VPGYDDALDLIPEIVPSVLKPVAAMVVNIQPGRLLAISIYGIRGLRINPKY